MEITNETFQLILDKIDSLEKSMSDKIDALSALLNHKIDTIEAKNTNTESKLAEHEGWLKRHDKDISCLQNADATKAKNIVREVLKYGGGVLIAFVFYKLFPWIAEVIK